MAIPNNMENQSHLGCGHRQIALHERGSFASHWRHGGSVVCFFFLCCRIALDSCGQVIARSQKEIEIQLTYRKQQETTQQHQQTEARVS